MKGGVVRVLHTSDLHGRYKPLLTFDQPFDLWLDTGDFFPNRGRVSGADDSIIPEEERSYQLRWLRLKSLPARIESWLAGRPMLCVPGNHDFVGLAEILRGAGADAAEISPDGIEHGGLTWAGFRQIPFMEGEWPGEVSEFSDVVARVCAAQPDVLATHGPALGWLDGTGRFGIPELTAVLGSELTPRAHFFGHEHEDGGSALERSGIRAFNGATKLRVVEL